MILPLFNDFNCSNGKFLKTFPTNHIYTSDIKVVPLSVSHLYLGAN